jgi:hypothetical protein
MTKAELFELVKGGPSAVAKIFGITPSAVTQWPDQVPEARVFELRGRRPDLFQPAASDAAAPQPVKEAA